VTMLAVLVGFAAMVAAWREDERGT